MMTAVVSSKVIGVAGGSGSGKTTVARELANRFGAAGSALIHLDSFYRAQPRLSLEERATVNYDHPDAFEFSLLAELLDQLKAGKPGTAPVYDFCVHSRTSTVEIRPAPIIIVEGVLVLHHPEILRRLDLGIFIDTPSGVRFDRRRTRDTIERARSPESVLQQWRDTVEPMYERFCAPSRRHAAIHLSGERPIGALIEEVIRAIEAGNTCR